MMFNSRVIAFTLMMTGLAAVKAQDTTTNIVALCQQENNAMPREQQQLMTCTDPNGNPGMLMCQEKAATWFRQAQRETICAACPNNGVPASSNTATMAMNGNKNNNGNGNKLQGPSVDPALKFSCGSCGGSLRRRHLDNGDGLGPTEDSERPCSVDPESEACLIEREKQQQQQQAAGQQQQQQQQQAAGQQSAPMYGAQNGQMNQNTPMYGAPNSQMNRNKNSQGLNNQNNGPCAAGSANEDCEPQQNYNQNANNWNSNQERQNNCDNEGNGPCPLAEEESFP